MSEKPLLFILFGSTGDLARKMIMPALCSLLSAGELPADASIIAFSRRAWSDDDYRAFVRPSLERCCVSDGFLSRVRYSEGHFHEPAAYERLAEKARAAISVMPAGAEVLIYLAVPPDFYSDILDGLRASGLNAPIAGSDQPKLMLEKPFGTDAASAAALERRLEGLFPPDSILRVDHYLGKAGLAELVRARTTDPKFEEGLRGSSVVSIAARLVEDIGLEGRADFYDRIGALRDVGQNHVLEMLATAIMDLEKPVNEARAEALESLSVVGEPELGQYEGYQREEGIAPGSRTETYFKFEMASSLPRWKDVRFFVEGGKAMAEKRSDVSLVYTDGSTERYDMNAPGRGAYETVLRRAAAGDRSYFPSMREVTAAWRIVDGIVARLGDIPLCIYKKGSKGL